LRGPRTWSLPLQVRELSLKASYPEPVCLRFRLAVLASTGGHLHRSLVGRAPSGEAGGAQGALRATRAAGEDPRRGRHAHAALGVGLACRCARAVEGGAAGHQRLATNASAGGARGAHAAADHARISRCALDRRISTAPIVLPLASSVRLPVSAGGWRWRAPGGRWPRKLGPLAARCPSWRRRSSQAGTRESSFAPLPLLHSCRPSPPGSGLGDWLQALRLPPGGALPPVGLRPPASAPRPDSVVEACRRPGAGGLSGAAATRAGGRIAPPAGEIGSRAGGLIAPELLCAKDTIPLRPRRCLVAAVKLAGGSNADRRFRHGRHLPPMCSMPKAPGREVEMDVAMAFAEEVGLERLGEDGDRRSPPAGGTTADPHRGGAGGGSRLALPMAKRLQVGPASAGADPGRLATAAAGRSPSHDANLLLGRLQGGGPIPRRCSAPRRSGARSGAGEAPAVRGAGRRVALATGGRARPESPGRKEPWRSPRTDGRSDQAEFRSSAAMTSRCHLWFCYGGAGGQHACALAERPGATVGLAVHPWPECSRLWHSAGRPAAAGERWCVNPFDAAPGGTAAAAGARAGEANPAPRAEFSVWGAARRQ